MLLKNKTKLLQQGKPRFRVELGLIPNTTVTGGDLQLRSKGVEQEWMENDLGGDGEPGAEGR